jgi:penicillin-binding protein 1C
MRDVSGISGAAPIWLEIMNFLHGSSPSHPPKAPEGIVTARVTFEKNVEPPREELFLAGAEPVASVTANTIYEAAHIVYPQEGTLITVDPDIPVSLQRVGLRFEPRGMRFR